MASEWDDYAAGWDDDPGARAYAVAAFRSLEDLLDERGLTLDGAAVCDFGCGTGLLTERMVGAARSIDAVDSSPATLDVLDAKIAHHGWANVHTMPAPALPATPYDVIVCSSVCGFLDDYPGTVVTLVAMLRPGGLFVQWDWEAAPDEEDSDGLSRGEIQAALSVAGLESVAVDVGFRADFEGETMTPLMGLGRRSLD